MSDQMFCTEKDVRDILINVVKEHDEAPNVFVVNRQQKPDSLIRTVTFVIQTKEGNENLINAVIKSSNDNQRAFIFTKSDINVQSGSFTVDYLFIEAKIFPKLT